MNKIIHSIGTPFLFITLYIFLNGSAASAVPSGESIVLEKKCASCHQFAGPASSSIAEIVKKRGPDLFYAGSKFQKNFLTSFLQAPSKIRPSGTMYLNHARYNEWRDEVVGVKGCESKLSGAEAGAVVDYLMTLKEPRLKSGAFKVQRFSRSKARIMFEKNLSCHACHQIRNKSGEIVGGVSAPVLHNAGTRLNADWVYSFMKDPQFWYPKVWMPKYDMDDETLMLISNYIMLMK